MLVPGIHSDSKVKLQEEVCTRNNGFWASSERLAFPFFFSLEFRVQSLEISLCGVLGELPGLFVGTEEKQSKTPLNALCSSAVDTERWGKVASGGWDLTTFLCWTRRYLGSLNKVQYVPHRGFNFYKNKKKREKSARMTQKHTHTHTNTHQGGKVRLHLSSLLPPLMSSSKQLPQK